MDELEQSAELLQSIFDSQKWICPVCKNDMPEDEDDAIWANRIRRTHTNIAKYGDRLIVHPFNGTWVCSVLCVERVARSWENATAEPRKEKLISEIKEDIARFERAIINAQSLLYAPKQKRKKK